MSNQCSTDVPLGVVKYAGYLKSVYKVKQCGKQWLPVVSKHYINLCTIESIEDFPKEKEVTCTLAMIQSKIEEVKEQKKSIRMDEVSVIRQIVSEKIRREIAYNQSLIGCVFMSRLVY